MVVATRDLTRQSGGALGRVEMIMMVVAMVDIGVIVGDVGGYRGCTHHLFVNKC